MHPTLLLVGLSCSAAVTVVAFRQHHTSRLHTSTANTIASDSSFGVDHYFDQFIDHANPSLGTFKQRFFFNDTFWTGQGAPVVISNSGEDAADSSYPDLTEPSALQHALMKSLGAAGVVLERLSASFGPAFSQRLTALRTDRYWGLSSPFQNLTTDNLKYLTLNQSIEDTKYFVENVRLPWSASNLPTVTSSHPEQVPWVSLGCSYPGLLAALTQEKYPGIFAAAWATSAPVQAQGDFWQYYEPIEEGMPKNCSSDAALVVKAVDQLLLNGTAEDKLRLKDAFGLRSLTDDDFGSAISWPIGRWQGMRASSYEYDGEDLFFQWCDSMETFANGTVNISPKGVGLERAIVGYAEFIRSSFGPDCYGGACYSTYNYSQSYYADWTPDNSIRQWMWMVCNEFGWWQDGDPGNYSSIVSSLVTPEYNLRQCNYLFPNADGTPGNFNPNTAGTNAIYGGWNLTTPQLFVVNGQYDPWRSASLSSIWAPQLPPSTSLQPIEVLAGGHHCWDWDLDGAYFNPDVKRVVDLGIDTVRGWLKTWYAARPNITNRIPEPKPDVWADIPQQIVV
ncbi:hypothetical protein FRB99_001833 [Tulasnella sp. 403]|nr:hypothetical protein FRB99_001833 [Tulasnella sp. 403]